MMVQLKATVLVALLFVPTATCGSSGTSRRLNGTVEDDDGPNSWCHCDAPDELHCNNETLAAESFCECHDHNGTLEVECPAVDPSCHCENMAEIHCDNETSEELALATCECHEGKLECIGDEEHEGEHDHGDEGDHGSEEEVHPSKWCHCDSPDELHCSAERESAESFCECHVHDGELEVHCQEVDASCHCDGSDIHCSDESSESVAAATCHCHEGTLECIEAREEASGGEQPGGAEEHPNSWCHCESSEELHCEEERVSAEPFCECHMHDGVMEVECQEAASSCHCDGSDIHCSSESEEELAMATCQCHEGSLECIGDEVNREPSDESKPWAQVIVTCLLVNVVTLAGLLVVAGEWLQRVFCPGKVSEESKNNWKGNLIPMFACGAVLATAFFLILPEALHLIQSAFGGGHDGHNHRMLREQNPESQATWRWGTSILAGILIPVVTHAFFPHHHAHEDQTYGASTTSRMVTLHDDADSSNESYSGTRDAASSIDAAVPMEQPIDLTSDDEEEVVADDYLPNDDVETPSSFHSDSAPKQDTKASSVVTRRAPTQEPYKSTVNEKGDLHDPRVARRHVMTRRASIARRRSSIQQAMTKVDRHFNVALLLSLSIGDFFHQFADGVFIGTAWLLCDRSLAITIAVATVIHEFPHQLADYLMMVNYCGVNRWYGLSINFLTGLGLLLGGVVVLAFLPNNLTIGVILAIGGGLFLHVAISECLNMAEKHQTSAKHKLQGFLAFILGCVPIGLVLLNHEHCGAH